MAGALYKTGFGSPQTEYWIGKYTLERTEGTIQNGEFRDTGNIGYTRQKPFASIWVHPLFFGMATFVKPVLMPQNTIEYMSNITGVL
jgi:hypothetical protein